jgi:hypothetical protein
MISPEFVRVEQVQSSIQAVDDIVRRYYPSLVRTVHAALAVIGAMALKGRTKPLSVIFETASGYGKTASLQMTFPLPPEDGKKGVEPYIYRSDKFTPKAFVSHAASIKAEKLADVDLLPRLENKVLVTKELAPLFRGRVEELQDNFSILISVLDGKGFTSDSGMRGRRGYERPILFNWLGATTPLPASTHRLMSQLGTRLLFYEVPCQQPSEEELLKYASEDGADAAEIECQQVVNDFLIGFFAKHPIGSVALDSIVIPQGLVLELIRWARFLVQGRAEIRYEKEFGVWQPVAVMTPEGPWKVINYFKELSRGHALIHERCEVNDADLKLIANVAISSIPGHLRPIIRELRTKASVDTAVVEKLCRVTAPTARRYLKELGLLGIGSLAKGSPENNQPDAIALAEQFRWIRLEP